MKSRQFEKDLENVIIVENNISRGAVKDKQKWLQTAFREQEDDSSWSKVSHERYARSEIAGGTSTYSFNRFRLNADSISKYGSNDDVQSEIITDDAASSLSVADKKDWLKNAFASRGEASKAPSPAKHAFPKARTEVVVSTHGTSRDEAASRAKLRFKERSARKLLERNAVKETTAPKPQRESLVIMQVPEKKSIEISSASTMIPNDAYRGAESSGDSNHGSSVVEDDAPVDFRAARAALVQRGKKNGHEMQVVNKVYLRKKKYEKIEEENRRKSSVHGLLKPSWDLVDPSKGLAKNTYEKHFISEVAPKKSFEELP
jgi:hypothetical protein